MATWLTEWNFPGAVPPRLLFVTDEPTDLNGQAAREKLIYETTGLCPTLERIETIYGAGWAVRAVQSAASPTIPVPSAIPAPPGEGAQFAEANGFSAQHAVDAVPAPDQQFQAIVEAMIQPILARMKEGITPEELLNFLGESYPKMHYQQLTEILDRLMFAGNAWGRIDGHS